MKNEFNNFGFHGVVNILENLKTNITNFILPSAIVDSKMKQQRHFHMFKQFQNWRNCSLGQNNIGNNQ